MIGMKEIVKEIIESTGGAICERCLGRILSRELKVEGHDNLERGKKIKEKLNLDLKSENRCYICDNIFDKIDEAAEKAEDKINELDIEFSTFLVGSTLPPDMLQRDKEITSLVSKAESIKKDINREIGKRLRRKLKKRVDYQNPDIVVKVNFRYKDPNVYIQINPLYLEGRYRKLVRGIPQTKWPCKHCRGKGCPKCNFKGKMYEESVEEIIAGPLIEATKARESKFHGAGREDIDVRMLGKGRPFVIELKEPRRRKLDLDKIVDEINKSAEGKVEVLFLKYTNRSRIVELKSIKSYKVYRAIAEIEGKIKEEDLKKIEPSFIVKQRTPLRVSHRRADKVRIRKVYDIKPKILDENTIELKIKAEGGLYIKELISGDEGRTKPSITEMLGKQAKCIKLDVIDIGI
nr:tRNA pseudouridine(54/55) synthase Pus10 [Methanothermus fervidus]